MKIVYGAFASVLIAYAAIFSAARAPAGTVKSSDSVAQANQRWVGDLFRAIGESLIPSAQTENSMALLEAILREENIATAKGKINMANARNDMLNAIAFEPSILEGLMVRIRNDLDPLYMPGIAAGPEGEFKLTEFEKRYAQSRMKALELLRMVCDQSHGSAEVLMVCRGMGERFVELVQERQLTEAQFAGVNPASAEKNEVAKAFVSSYEYFRRL